MSLRRTKCRPPARVKTMYIDRVIRIVNRMEIEPMSVDDGTIEHRQVSNFRSQRVIRLGPLLIRWGANVYGVQIRGGLDGICTRGLNPCFSQYTYVQFLVIPQVLYKFNFKI